MIIIKKLCVVFTLHCFARCTISFTTYSPKFPVASATGPSSYYSNKTIRSHKCFTLSNIHPIFTFFAEH